MNRRQVINKVIHKHIDVDPLGDYTNYKNLITAIEEWYEEEVEKLMKPPDILYEVLNNMDVKNNNKITMKEVEKYCDENGYHKDMYWFPYK